LSVVGILKFQKWFDADILDFPIYIFGIFGFGDFLGYFLKNWAIFFKISGHPA
jgi:hypothetical protein